MKSRFKVLGHPLHPILVVFPLAFYPLAALAEIVYLVLRVLNYHNADRLLTFDVGFFWRTGFLLLIVGLLGHAAAGLPGLVDWLNIPNDAPSKDKATFHLVMAVLIGGVAVMSILLLNWGEPYTEIRLPDDLGLMVGAGLNILNGMMLVSYQGWLGGELVYRHGIGVERSDDIDPIAITPAAEGAPENG